MKSRSHKSLISSQLWLMRPGESVTFTRLVDKLPVGNAANRMSMLITSYVARRRPGCTWSFESFAAITHSGNLLAGVVVKLLTDPEETHASTNT